jgi:hypothetical protein
MVGKGNQWLMLHDWAAEFKMMPPKRHAQKP